MRNTRRCLFSERSSVCHACLILFFCWKKNIQTRTLSNMVKVKSFRGMGAENRSPYNQIHQWLRAPINNTTPDRFPPKVLNYSTFPPESISETARLIRRPFPYCRRDNKKASVTKFSKVDFGGVFPRRKRDSILIYFIVDSIFFSLLWKSKARVNNGPRRRNAAFKKITFKLGIMQVRLNVILCVEWVSFSDFAIAVRIRSPDFVV